MPSGVFEDVKLKYRGQEYVIESNRVMGAIARIEQHITMKEMFDDAQNSRMRLAPVAMAFASVLEYAGAKGISQDEVYQMMVKSGEDQVVVLSAVSGLLAIMMPPSKKDDVPSGESNRRTRRAAASSSRRRTRRPSGVA